MKWLIILISCCIQYLSKIISYLILTVSLSFQLSLRDNDLISLPKEIGDLAQLKELHIQGNRLTVLPPELGETCTCTHVPGSTFYIFQSKWSKPVPKTRGQWLVDGNAKYTHPPKPKKSIRSILISYRFVIICDIGWRLWVRVVLLGST